VNVDIVYLLISILIEIQNLAGRNIVIVINLRRKNKMTKINNQDDWAEDIINGIGGFKDYVRYEKPFFNHEEDVEIVLWTIKCLSNKNNKSALKQLEKAK